MATSEKEKIRGKQRYWADIAKSRAKAAKYYQTHKDKIKERRKKNMPVLVKRSERIRYKKKYGMTLEQVQELKQAGCIVCGSMTRLHVDHCHATGKVRGCLCQRCNQALGLLNEDIERIKRLAQYIDFFQRQPCP